MEKYEEWQKKAAHYKNLTQKARELVKTTRNDNPTTAPTEAQAKKKVTFYGESLPSKKKTDSENTFVTGVGIGEEEVHEEKRPMPVPELGPSMYDQEEGEEGKEEISYESLLKDTDDLEEVRRMIKSVSLDINNYETDLRGITSSVSALNKDLKSLGMGFDDKIITDIQDSFRHVVNTRPQGMPLGSGKGINSKTTSTGPKDRGTGALAKSSLEGESQKNSLPPVKNFKVRTSSAANKKRA